MLTSCQKTLGPDYTLLETIPTKEQVGAHVLPDEIAPISAPFDMPRFKKPEFPDFTIRLDLTDADSSDLITKQIEKAINNLSASGGGRLIIPKGIWKTGRIELLDNINLHFEDGAVLKFSTDVKDYQPAVFTRVESLEVMALGSCIYAHGANNIAITGSGRLIGPFGGEIKERMYLKPIEGLIDLDLPSRERIHDGSNEDWIFPPMFIAPINCTNVYLEGFSLENTSFWNIVPTYCENVVIRGVTVNSVGIPRGDGIDIESSKNVLIEYCTLATGDDCFTLKSGRGMDGLRVGRPTENVVIRHCLAMEGHGGITCGSETAGTIRNLYAHDCVFEGTGVGIRFKTRRPRGGGGEKLYYDRIRMNLKYTAIKWDMLGSSAHVGELANRLPKRAVNELTPFYRDISIRNLIIENSTHFLKVLGIPESPMTNLMIDNADITSQNLIILNDAQSVTVRNAKITSPDSLISMLDSKDVTFENVDFQVNGGQVVVDVQGEEGEGVRFVRL